MPTADGPAYGLPEKQGLYDPRQESEACGVGFVVSIDGIRSHKVYFYVTDFWLERFVLGVG